MRNYIGLWVLLAVAFAIFVVVSAIGTPDIAGFQPKRNKMADAMFVMRDTAAVVKNDTVAHVRQNHVAEVDTTPKVLMIVGDSMLEGLSPRLAAYAKQNGHTLYTVMWYSSQTQAWGSSGKIAQYKKQLNPDFIFICLGANELFVKDIEEKRLAYVKQMVAELGDTPYLWIGPPNWKPDTGINRLIADNVPSQCYFKSDGMTFERAKDGAHPTRNSAIDWMDSVVRWMPAHLSVMPRFDVPEFQTARPKKIFVHQPSEIN